jgi:hypothetical protein
MITKEIIVERKEAILVDLDTVKNRLEEIEKAKLENIALQNALMGALQQCDDFLGKLDNVSGDEG